MVYNSAYTTPNAVIRQLEKANPVNVPSPEQSEYDDFFELVSEYCNQASAYISTTTGRYFVPYREDVEHYIRDLILSRRVRRGKLYLDNDIIVINSLESETSAGTVAISASDYRLVNNNTASQFPYNAIQFMNTTNTLPIFWADETSRLLISATWGYHTSLAQMYTSVETLAGTINASVTTITVADASRYEVLQYLRIESELLQVTTYNVNTNVITVVRGANGTTAASHTNYTIERYNVTPTIAQLATRLVAWMYQHRNDVSSRVQYADGSSSFEDLPPLFHKQMMQMVRMDTGNV